MSDSLNPSNPDSFEKIEDHLEKASDKTLNSSQGLEPENYISLNEHAQNYAEELGFTKRDLFQHQKWEATPTITTYQGSNGILKVEDLENEEIQITYADKIKAVKEVTPIELSSNERGLRKLFNLSTQPLKVEKLELQNTTLSQTADNLREAEQYLLQAAFKDFNK